MDFIARFLIVTMFLYASLANPFKSKGLKELMKAKSVPFIDVAFPLAHILMFLASVAIILNFYVAIAALALIAFMSFATYYFADFWNVQGMDRDMSLNQFTANLTIIGGLLLLVLRSFSAP